MIDLELYKAHPRFDLTLELLITLPVEPRLAPMADLMEDFDCANQKQLKDLGAKLGDRGIKVITARMTSRKGNGMAIAHESDQTAQLVAKAYWLATRGDSHAPQSRRRARSR